MIAPNKAIFEMISQERERQSKWIELIASENYPSKTVQSVVWSIFMAKYAEWYPLNSDLNWQKWRYYGWCEVVDTLENSTRDLALLMFKLDKAAWHVNVQPHSWSNANEAALMSILNLWDTILSFDLSHWGHLSHWMKLNTSGRNYNIIHYWVDKETWVLNYDSIEAQAIEVQPKVIIAWASAYSREIDFKRFREIADKVWAKLFVDMAHIAWLIVAELHNSPFEAWADIVTTTTHKTLRWNRGWLIFCKTELAKKIDTCIFPWVQGWPLMNEIAGKNQAFYEACSEEYKEYMKQVKENAKQLSEKIMSSIEWTALEWTKLVSGWTDNHLFMLDFSWIEIKWETNVVTWLFVQNALWKYDITVNKNLVPFDTKSPKETSWIRIWTPAITTRWLNEMWVEALGGLIVSILNHEITKEYLLSEEEKENITYEEEELEQQVTDFVNAFLHSDWIDWKDFLS